MALIKCAECGKEISDKAKTCVNCGCPIKEAFKQEEKQKNNSRVVKNYNELTREEKLSVRLFMIGKSITPTSQIVLGVLGTGCIILGLFFAFWFFFLIVGICLIVSSYVVQTENEKKFYYKYPNSASEKLDIVKQNRKNTYKQLPIMIIGIICSVIGIITGFTITDDSFEFIPLIFLGVGFVCYILCIYKMIKNTKK